MYFSSERFNRDPVWSILILEQPGSRKKNRKWLKSTGIFWQNLPKFGVSSSLKRLIFISFICTIISVGILRKLINGCPVSVYDEHLPTSSYLWFAYPFDDFSDSSDSSSSSSSGSESDSSDEEPKKGLPPMLFGLERSPAPPATTECSPQVWDLASYYNANPQTSVANKKPDSRPAVQSVSSKPVSSSTSLAGKHSDLPVQVWLSVSQQSIGRCVGKSSLPFHSSFHFRLDFSLPSHILCSQVFSMITYDITSTNILIFLNRLELTSVAYMGELFTLYLCVGTGNRCSFSNHLTWQIS